LVYKLSLNREFALISLTNAYTSSGLIKFKEKSPFIMKIKAIDMLTYA